MSSENVYSLAQEFEEKYNQTTDLVTCIKSAKQPRSRLQEVAQQLEGLDYLLNQMDLEVSLLPKEDQGEISIHKTCRNHFNELRKKHMEVESRPPASKSTPVVDRETTSWTPRTRASPATATSRTCKTCARSTAWLPGRTKPRCPKSC